MRRIAILGSTGSIGRSTLEVVRQLKRKFQVVALSANSNIHVLSGQIKEFHPAAVSVRDETAAFRLRSRYKLGKTKLFSGQAGLEAMLEAKFIDKIILAISGSDALLPLLAAIKNGRDIALANKEALVMAGPVIMREAQKKKVKILPVDSEQSAIWQCLDGQDRNKIRNIYLTASGGPFRQVPKLDLKHISINRVLRHPRWKMGKKITVDSATLMNKGLEVLETMFLFNITAEKIKVLIHPEAIIHSMVEFIDGVILAQLSVTDMRIPIQYALAYPERLPSRLSGVDFYKLKALHFAKPDLRRFPCLELAYRAGRELGTVPAVLNAANEVSVEEFLKGRLNFGFIPSVIEKVLGRHHKKTVPDLNDILEADTWARSQAQGIIHKM